MPPSPSGAISRGAAPWLAALLTGAVPLLALAQDPPPDGPAPDPSSSPPAASSAPPPATSSAPPPATSSAPPPATSSAPPVASSPPLPPVATAPASARPAPTPRPTTAPPAAPPPSTAAPPPSAAPPSEKKDDARGWEWLWLSGEGGLQYLSLTTLSSKGSLVPGIKKESAMGPMGGLAAGIRLFYFTIGLHARAANLSQYMYWSLDPELGIHFGSGDIQPYLLFGAGYSALGSLDSSSISSQSGVKVRGFNLRAGFGLDYYVTHTISLGVLGTGEITAMTRPGVSASDLDVAGKVQGQTPPANTNDPQQLEAQRAQLEAQAAAESAKVDGSGVGVAAALTLVLGFHF